MARKQKNTKTSQKGSGKDGIIQKAAKNPMLVGATGLALASGMVAVGVVLANKNMRTRVKKGAARVGRVASELTERAVEYQGAIAHRVAPVKTKSSKGRKSTSGKKATRKG